MKKSLTLYSLLLLFNLFLPSTSTADVELSLKTIDKSIRLREYQQAVKLLQPLLKQNIAEAQYRMAGLYRSGTGVKKDMEKAMIEYRKASNNGLAKAQFALASLLEKRGSSRQKMVEIQKWYQAAADQGHRKAKIKLQALSAKSTAGSSTDVSQEIILSAIRNNAVDQVKTYIENGINMNFKDNQGRSPVLISLLSKNHEIAELLTTNSSLLDSPDNNHNYPLHLATADGYSDVVTALLKRKININVTDNLGNTALIIATRHQDTTIMEKLLDQQADYTIKNKKNQSALQIAQTLHLNKARKIFQQYNIKLPDINKDYQQVDIKSFQSIIAKNSSLYKGWPLINIASLLGETEIVKQLLNQGAKINATDTLGNSSLHRAASKGQLKTVKLLLANGSNINAVNNKQQTALYIAAETGNSNIVNFLLEKGADSSLVAKNKTSPLSIAIINQHRPSATALTASPLDEPSIHRALLLSIQNKLEDISVELVKRDKLLLFADDKDRSTLWHSADKGLLQTTRELLKNKNINIDLTDKNGYSALARAVNNGFLEISTLLIDRGASIDTLTKAKNNLLMISVRSENPALFKKILGLKINLDAKNNLGDTVLMMATRIGNIEFVKTLIDAGADIKTRNLDDLNAYQIAINSGHDDIAKLIKDSSGKLFKLFN